MPLDPRQNPAPAARLERAAVVRAAVAGDALLDVCGRRRPVGERMPVGGRPVTRIDRGDTCPLRARAADVPRDRIAGAVRGADVVAVADERAARGAAGRGGDAVDGLRRRAPRLLEACGAGAVLGGPRPDVAAPRIRYAAGPPEATTARRAGSAVVPMEPSRDGTTREVIGRIRATDA